MKHKKQILSLTVYMMMTVAFCTGVSQASDIEIYKDATLGKTSILLMLDTSGSMGISSLVLPKNNRYGSPGDVDVPLCDRKPVSEYYSNRNSSSNIYEWAYNLKDNNQNSPTYNKTSIYKSVNIGNTAIPYYVRGCSKDGIVMYDRLSRLKDAIIPLLASGDLSNNVMMGLGQFSSKTELTIGTASNRLTDGHSGRILVPNAPLSLEQRVRIAKEIAAIKSLDTTTNEDGTPNSNLNLSSNNYPNVTKASSGTPTVHAYAEAAAYMMGTTTGGANESNNGQVAVIYDGYMVKQQGDNDGQVYFICKQLGTSTTNALGAVVMMCPSNWPEYDANNRTASKTTIYDADGKQVSYNDYKNYVATHPELGKTNGQMTRLWDVYKNLPIGWSFDGWMRVDNEPMDIEPIVGTVWGYGDGIRGLVSYRTSPFSFKTGQVGTKTGFLDCPSGYNVIQGWQSLCQSSAAKQSRPATQAEINANQCLSPAVGNDPMTGARDPNGNIKTDEHYNMARTYMERTFFSRTCVQTDYAVVRPWGDTPVYGAVESNFGGFPYSAQDTKNGSVYKAGGSTDTCDGNGIYFLTDGAPNSTKDNMARTIMNTSLNNDPSYMFQSKPTGAGVLVSPNLSSGLFAGETGGWEYIGEYAKKIFNHQQNPANMTIKTAVVGFGSSFAGVRQSDGTYNCDAVKSTNQDAYNACLWGSNNYGNGGFYYAENSTDIRNSIVDFVKKAAVTIDSVATGAPTIPKDSLNPVQQLSTAYYASFTPKPQSAYQLWLGNLNKYNVMNGQITGTNNLRLITETGSLNKSTSGLWMDGALGQLPLGLSVINSMTSTNRKILTNRDLTNTSTKEKNSLEQVTIDSLFNRDGKFLNDPYKKYWLNLMGFNITDDNPVRNNIPAQADLRQFGAIMHSKPILLTQSGKITYNNNQVDTQDRQDYVLFGNTQGLLQVLDNNTGKEVFAFAPNEFFENEQKKAYLIETATTGGKDKLFYGMDAPWVAYTQYISKKDGTLTVSDSGRTVQPTDKADQIALKGLQWVYGGLRMGGRSYYSLDLSNINTPALKFHIDPDKQQIVSAASATPFSVPALQFMGQSWSKPTIAYVNFGGEKKLVMFVGGGYDTGYENPLYNQTNNIGGGIYMFDAITGELLWWGGANATANMGAQAYTNIPDLKYSVVSQINAIDRDGDGLVDHLYFGSLAGQAFRIDLNNAALSNNKDATSQQKKANFFSRVTRLYDVSSVVLGSARPRFYEMPSFSIHQGQNGLYGIAAFSSGDASSPLAGSSGTNANGLATAVDGLYVLYDNDVAQANLYSSNYIPASYTKTVADVESFSSDGVPQKNGNLYNRGWKYTYSNNNVSNANVNGRIKGIGELYALDSYLFVNVFDRDGVGVAGACGSGVKGDSYVYQFCLPSGKCDFPLVNANQPNRVKTGVGLVSASLGNATANKSDGLTGLVTANGNLDCSQTPNLPQCQKFKTTTELKQLRWYDAR